MITQNNSSQNILSINIHYTYNTYILDNHLSDS